ncbi:lipase B [Emericellopsis cladophorae]|uniref:Lipase B n=1 Tax=Emericellopsis cladophorae TaxID=2686198 RepID=A0A9P9XZM7_9HYPO|nr:lipase B [Emericellopsis cladophorae]KAI6780610.1 lipase B [Emericellopsis cladophorae]
MRLSAVILGLRALCFASPAPFEERLDVVNALANGVVDDVDEVVRGLLGHLSDAVNRGDRDEAIGILQQMSPPRKTLESTEEAMARLQAIAAISGKELDIVNYAGKLIANGLISGTVDAASNPPPPKQIYPKENSCDPAYSMAEDDLRSAIYIPPGFTYGEKPPVILFPGTGSNGYTTFKGNFIPLLTDVDWADPVWVNVPGFLNDDAQGNAEHAAYAMHYIAAITKRDIGIIAWSQGNIDVQWALKYWPSTREVTTDHVAINADYKGTILANLLTLSGLINNPSVLQQKAGSDFINTLRADGGDSGYVPTTSIYSGFLDQIVQPQSGTIASAYMLDERGVGVTNAEVQKVCKGGLAGTLYTHESTLANPLAFALAKDALTHAGPGNLSRLDLGNVCASYLAPGLGLDDFLVTENALVIAVLSIVTYLPKAAEEPALRGYTVSPPQCKREQPFSA